MHANSRIREEKIRIRKEAANKGKNSKIMFLSSDSDIDESMFALDGVHLTRHGNTALG